MDVHIRPVFDFDFLENAVATAFPLTCRAKLMMAKKMFFVSHEEVVGHPKHQNVNKEGNDQENHELLDFRVLER